MKQDVFEWAAGRPTKKMVSKETLNHRGLIEMVSGLDVYANTPEAYRRAYEALGIDIINRVPLENAPELTRQGERRYIRDKEYYAASLGVYDTIARHTYPCASVEDVWSIDWTAADDAMIDPVPHPLSHDDILRRQKAIDEVGMYYPMLYTTLFMWPVEALGWELFMTAAALEPERFHEKFLVPCVPRSASIVTEMARATDSPFVFVHDDLAISTGPAFTPKWYEQYIFPHYSEILQGARELGKNVVLVADGNLTAFLPRLKEIGFDGIMFENPATSLDAVIEHFGDRVFIGGIETARLTFESPDEIRRMVIGLAELASDCPGFAIACCGGLHGNIPLRNLEAYFDARVEIGATPADWRTRCAA